MTFEELKSIWMNTFYLEDDELIRVSLSSVIANTLNEDPVWLMLIAPSGAGKTEIINALESIQKQTDDGFQKNYLYPISQLTENSFLSGAQNAHGESSLLHEIGTEGILGIKDFTSIIGYNDQRKQAVISQLREIYDGKMSKRTGNMTESLEWEGKIGLIAGSTHKLYQLEEQFADLGTRWLVYEMSVPEGFERTMMERRLKGDQETGSMVTDESRNQLKDAVAQFMQPYIAMDKETKSSYSLEDETYELIMDIAEVVAPARTPASRDFRGEVTFIHPGENPTRLAVQVRSIATALAILNGGGLIEKDYTILKRLLWTSLSKPKRHILEIIYSHHQAGGAESLGIAQEMDHPTKVIDNWLEDLNGQGTVSREPHPTRVGANIWKLSEKTYAMMKRYFTDLSEKTSFLQGVSETEDYEASFDRMALQNGFGGGYQHYDEKKQKEIDEIRKQKDFDEF